MEIREKKKEQNRKNMNIHKNKGIKTIVRLKIFKNTGNRTVS